MIRRFLPFIKQVPDKPAFVGLGGGITVQLSVPELTQQAPHSRTREYSHGQQVAAV
jgi:hypothetical protein